MNSDKDIEKDSDSVTSQAIPANDDGALKSELSDEWDSRRSWLMLTLSFFVFVFLNGYINCIGVIQRHFTEDMLGHSSATVVVAGSMQVAFLNLVGSPAGIAAERFGYRVVLMAGCLLSMVGLLLASFVNADNLWLLVLSHGALIGSAAALLVIPLCSIPTVWFLKRRGLANGILMAANGISGLAFPPLMQKLIDTVGIHWTLRIFILVVAVIGGIPSWFIHESNHASSVAVASQEPDSGSKPEQHSQSSTSQSQSSSVIQRVGAKLRAVLGLVADFSLLQNKPFIVVSILNFTSGCAFFIPYQYLPTYATRQGFTTDQAALLASLLGAGQIIGGFGGGLLMDYIGVYNLLVLVQLLSTLTPAVLWTLSQQFSVLVAFSVTYGIASGAGVLTTGPSVAVLFDVRRVPSALGMLFLMFGLGIIATFTAYGPLEDVDPVNMYPLIIFTAVFNFVTMVLSMYARWMISPKLSDKV